MKIIDACLFFNELDILELRIQELYAAVDRFVIVEATHTHKGDPKPLHFAENKKRFAKWWDKIEHVVVGDLPTGDGLPAIRRREMTQRNAILRGVRDCDDDDILLISDADEIPRVTHLPFQGLPDGAIITYRQALHYYNFNTKATNGLIWQGTRACRVADARALSPHVVRYGLGTPDQHYPIFGAIDNAGWHFSYFGGADAIREKQTQFLHQELVTDANTDPAAIAARVASGQDIWGRTNEQKFTIGPASDLPYAVLRDITHYAPHFHPDWRPTFHEDWYNGDQALFVGQLAKQAPAGAIVEIGAWEGRSSVVLAQAIAPRVLHVIDHWKGNLDEDPDHFSGELARERDVEETFMHNLYRLTSGNVIPWCYDWHDWIGEWAKEADPSIAFLHLDASHDRASVRDCLLAVRPFLVPGAILCGDDAYDEQVMAGVHDVFPDAEIVGERLWKWVHDA